ncbi:MAG: alpha/beta fold hydrolase [Nitrospirales bacterium]|nr:alpha/beta fold hydrolase [Nitrospirales bacterium]
MNTPISTSRGVIVFVHGFGSSRACWDALVPLLQSDRAITERFDLDFFEYPTDWVTLKPTERIPGHKELAQKFHAFLASERFPNREMTLIGHSQGGLIIHAYLNYMVEEGWGKQLESIRQVITFATPHYGSNLFSGLRRLFSRFIDNPQERRLRTLDEDMSDVVRNVNNRIATTHQADGAHWPIPVFCFGGLSDNVVPKASAQGPFVRYTPLTGNHSTILAPANRDDDRYRELKGVLLDPVGHPHVFEIEHYDTTIVVGPVERRTFTVNLGEGRTREIETDNVCELNRTVRFANNNTCQQEFKMRYLAFNGSCFEADTSHDNAAGQLKSEYRAGEKIDFLFVPKLKAPTERYSLGLKIYNGFEAGRTDVHFHLGPKSIGARAYYRTLTYTLDLSRYIASGMTVTPPRFYLHHHDPGDCAKCQNRRKQGTQILPHSEPRDGVWHWELHNIRQGVTDLFWDIGPSAG